jgi:serine/threonine-protein kinase
MNDVQPNLNGAELEGEILMGHYFVESKIGKGGMAWVYKAVHLETNELVACKILFSHLSTEPKTRARFIREAEIMEQLEHPNIVQTLGLIDERGVIGMLLEWCDGGDLFDAFEEKQGPLPLSTLQSVFLPLLDAMSHAHQRGFIHRDLKLQNVLLQRHGDVLVPKIADFGVAKVLLGSQMTQTGTVMGTLEFMSPEQLRDSKRVDHRADIYSLGMMLYYFCTGYLPFNGSQHQLIMQILSFDPQPPDNAPPELTSIIMMCLKKDPDERFASCASLRHAWFKAVQIAQQPLPLSFSAVATKKAAESRALRDSIHPTAYQEWGDGPTTKKGDLTASSGLSSSTLALGIFVLLLIAIAAFFLWDRILLS